MKFFVSESSIVRKIWGKADTVLFIFAGAAAEFALNKAVDWLYFTGKLPSDPLNRLFSTVTYARQIIFSEEEKAWKAIDRMNVIHKGVESARGAAIPDWAYRDVLYMLIDYSIRSYEVLETKLREEEKQEVFNVFIRVGNRMGLKELPDSYTDWIVSREEHLNADLIKSHFTIDLFKQYRKHLGWIRYILLIEVQTLITPGKVRELLSFRFQPFIQPLIYIYKMSRRLRMDSHMKNLLLPGKYKEQIYALDIK
jgi:hypothetical protein